LVHNFFGKLVIPLRDIVSVKKKAVALILRGAVQIAVKNTDSAQKPKKVVARVAQTTVYLRWAGEYGGGVRPRRSSVEEVRPRWKEGLFLCAVLTRQLNVRGSIGAVKYSKQNEELQQLFETSENLVDCT
jgi:hypothetical protein